MTKLGQRLVESAYEALAIAEGRVAPARILEPPAVDVAGLRKRLRLSQSAFAARYGLAVATVRDWEQKRRRPDRMAMNLLRIIEHSPETAARALAGDA